VVPPIYVIHAKHLDDRRVHIERELGRFSLPFEWVTDFDPPEISAETEAAYFVPGHGLRPAQMSCALKHIVAMQRVVDGGTMALVLEDDVILRRDFPALLDRAVQELEKEGPKAVAYLGQGARDFVPSRARRPGHLLHSYLTHDTSEALLLKPAAARARLNLIAKSRLTFPIDTTFNYGDAEIGVERWYADPPLANQGTRSGRFESAIFPRNRPLWITVLSRRHRTLVYRLGRLFRQA
jgi:glycosyl transferase family 25